MQDAERHRWAADSDINGYLMCPKCASGSDETMRRADAVGEWGEVLCPACDKMFQVAHAIDEMFARGDPWGYVLWLGCKRLTKYVRCAHGETQVVLLDQEFSEIYRAIPMFQGGYCLSAGGVVIECTTPETLVVGVAGPPSVYSQPLHILITVLGRSRGAPSLIPWRRLLLESRLAAFNAAALTPIHAVSAIDLFVEALTGIVVEGQRPGSWNTAVRSWTGVSLRELMGKRAFQNLEILVQVRNKIAHGRDYLEPLPHSVRESEIRWYEHPKEFQGEGAIAPLSGFSMRTALAVIRSCRQRALRSN